MLTYINNSLFGRDSRNEGIFTIIFYVLIVILSKNVVTKENVLKIINMIFGFGILQVLCGITQSYFKWFSFFDEMAYGFSSNPNMYGLLMGLLLTIALNLYLNTSKKYYLLCTICFYIGLLLGESSGPFFMFALFALFILIYHFLKKTDRKKLILLIVILIALLPLVQFSNQYVNTKYYEKYA